MDILTHITRSF
jgi:hypothetical protein